MARLAEGSMRSTGPGLFLAALLGAFAAAGTASAQYETSTVPQHPRPVPDRWFIIHAGALLADANQPPQHNVSIIVKNDKIQAIRPGFVEPKDVATAPPATVQVVDLSTKFVMPGFIDAHVHTGGDG